MGPLKATLCAGSALCAALAPATAYPAYAGDTDQVAVTPATPAPGSDVTLRVPGCAGKTAVAVSAAFESDTRLTLTSSDGALVGAGRIRASVEAGAYAVKVRCGSERHTGRLTVGDGSARPPAGRPPASPVAPVDAGGGGAARQLAARDAGTAHAPQDEARPAGPGTAHAVTGLVLAGVAAVAVALRSARRSRGTD
ncbi:MULTISPECIES: hypothetical protein [Streptomyces]|uniref:Sortase n=2 Tax=Streptomyces TaxID=1883 RepID=A0ABT9LGZ5_STRGD|nr:MULTISPECIES: hypothetical protein [Streptomyces]MDP9682012.1 hypothetical protein [Streptomyces griseoviridis]GGT03137.1 hypothetical protein GCM10010240_40660 [Streptomyces griseoviridis]GGU35349.1 hypothetical protein GCM10010259_27320 [Streptomyces daghestanicus]GHI33999.1 hypothetical protein Sdagh_57290 [Streptomyces daghestanicus]